jgi:hypothetical protein
MQTHQRPKSLSLRKVTKHATGQDIGSAHVIDYHLWLATRDWLDPLFRARTSVALPQIGRYLDGEEEREGTYR